MEEPLNLSTEVAASSTEVQPASARLGSDGSSLIRALIAADELEAFVRLEGLRPSAEEEPRQRLTRIGEEIVGKLVNWLKRLPFHQRLPFGVQTQLLTQRWAELVILSTAFYATHRPGHVTATHEEAVEDSEVELILFEPNESLVTSSQDEPIKQPRKFALSLNDPAANLSLLAERLETILRKSIPVEEMGKEAGPLVSAFTKLLACMDSLRLSPEAYVCLKALTLLNIDHPEGLSGYGTRVLRVQEQWLKALQIRLAQEEGGPRLADVLDALPKLAAAAALLLRSRLFYVPFLLVAPPPPNPSSSPVSAQSLLSDPDPCDTPAQS